MNKGMWSKFKGYPISVEDKLAMEDICTTIHKYPISWTRAAEILEIMGPVAQELSPSGAIEWLESTTSQLIKEEN